MESMSDFVASAVEFIVGGILFTLATAFLIVTLISPDGWPVLSERQMEFVSANTTLLGIIFIAASYAAGVIGESLARSQLEWLLDRQTVRHAAFQTPPWTAVVKRATPLRKPPEPSALGRRWGAFKTSLTERALGGDYDVASLKIARGERERQRAVVMTWHEQLNAEVLSQLKRLRLERVFTLSLGLTAIALAVRRDWLLFGAAAFAAVWGIWLVNTRFTRYCNSIARGHDLVSKERLTDPSGDAQVTTAITVAGSAPDARPAVIFDLDGTLIDSEPSWARGFSIGLSQILDERGHGAHPWRPEDMVRFKGGRVPDTVGTLLAEAGLDEKLGVGGTRQVVQAVIDWVTDDFAANPVPIAEAVETMRALHQRDVPLAVASSSALPFIDAALEALGLGDAVPTRLSAIDLPRGKPDPLVYLLTLHEMGLPASKVIAVEDSPVGVESAVRAGLQCVWFLPGMSRAERDEQVRALMATSTGEGTLARQVDALVSPVSSLTADSILTMLDSLAPHAAE